MAYESLCSLASALAAAVFGFAAGFSAMGALRRVQARNLQSWADKRRTTLTDLA